MKRNIRRELSTPLVLKHGITTYCRVTLYAGSTNRWHFFDIHLHILTYLKVCMCVLQTLPLRQTLPVKVRTEPSQSLQASVVVY